MANVNSTQTSFRIRLDLYDKLRFQAVKENRSQGEILNEALEDYLQKVENQTTFDEELWLKDYCEKIDTIVVKRILEYPSHNK